MKMENAYIKSLLPRMTLEQKIGAVLTLGFSGIVPRPHIYDYIERFHCGGLRLSPEFRMFGNYIDPTTKKTVVALENKTGYKYETNPPVATAEEYRAVLSDLQAAAAQRPLSLPLHFSYDQEGGSSADFFFGGVNIFPKPMGITATGDPKLAYAVAKAVAEQGRAVGFQWVHSPVLDINSLPENPEIYTRSYSDDAAVVAQYAVEACKGFRDGGMIATGKHFPGRGHSGVDAHFGVPVIDVDADTMMERELLPYRVLIAQKLLPSIMLAHSIFPAIDPDNIATVSKKVITGLLREKLGFEGVITTDSMTMGGIATRYGVANACALSLEAGADLVLMKAENGLVEETVAAIRNFVETGRIPMEALDEKVYRILSLKYDYGLFAHDLRKSPPPEQVLCAAEMRALAHTVALKSVQIGCDHACVLPLRSVQKVLVIEQKVKEYNSRTWHSGILFESCLQHSRNVSYLETDFSYDETDERRIREEIQSGAYDVIVCTAYFIRGKRSNRSILETILADAPCPVVIVSNTPYRELSIPQNAKTVLLTFSTSPESVEVVAGTLFGDIVPQGTWPLSHMANCL
ncbi:MAG: glycoside hydrolase family 3 protein, partial [Ruthenibacterium sp.]